MNIVDVMFISCIVIAVFCVIVLAIALISSYRKTKIPMTHGAISRNKIFWIARDYDGRLFIYPKYPQRYLGKWYAKNDMGYFECTLIPHYEETRKQRNIRWEDEPVKLEIKIRK